MSFTVPTIFSFTDQIKHEERFSSKLVLKGALGGRLQEGERAIATPGNSGAMTVGPLSLGKIGPAVIWQNDNKWRLSCPIRYGIGHTRCRTTIRRELDPMSVDEMRDLLQSGYIFAQCDHIAMVED